MSAISRSSRQHDLMTPASAADFERSRHRVNFVLIVAACLIVAFWVLWWSDRSLVASRTTASYYTFEDGFSLADGWLLTTVIAAAVQLWRRRASALLWLLAAGGAGLYLLGMDMHYDLAHRIYGSSSGGVIELVIDMLVAGTSVGVLWWSWRHRQVLLNPASGREQTRV
jgi:ferric-dicitrate binding protein FerR (iron transport regulator)